MGKSTGAKGTRQRTQGMFGNIPHVVLRHPLYITCTDRGIRLLNDLLVQVKFDGRGSWANNGDLAITMNVMRDRGWNSRDKLYKARDDLLRHRLIVQTRQGGLNHCALYAITWEPINQCRDKHGHDKLDVKATFAPVVNWHRLPAQPNADADVVRMEAFR